MAERIDVAVVGAGVVGMLTALVAQRSGLRVRLFEARAAATARGARLYMLHAAAKALLSELGIWSQLRSVVPVRWMRVCTSGGRWLNIEARACRLAALAHTVAEQELVAALQATLQAAKVSIAYSAPARSLQLQQHAALLVAGENTVAARLVVGADGQRSSVAQLAQLASRSVRLPHDAVVATARFSGLGHTAWQWINRKEVLAVLPGSAGASLIWSRPPAVARATAGWDDRQFNRAIDQCCAKQLGPCQVMDRRQVFALQETMHPPVAKRVALVGDSWHSIHPLAGQGLALGCGDVAVLARGFRLRDPGCATALGSYRRARVLRIALTRAVTHRIAVSDRAAGQLLEIGASLPVGRLLALLANQA